MNIERAKIAIDKMVSLQNKLNKGGIMQDFKTYESKHYDFYRFSRLVIDVIIDHHKFSIPYDIELEILYKAYQRFNYSDSLADPYKEQLEFISSDIDLLRDLQASNEGY